MPDTLFQDYRDVYEILASGWHYFLTEAQLNMDYYHDVQFTKKEESTARLRGRDLFVVNKLKRQINLLHGYEIRNRHILKIGPTEGEDDFACRQHTGVVMHLMSAGNVSGYDILSDAFKWGPLISGSNLLEIWKDRHGDLRYARHGFNQFLLDPGVNQRDLSDCENIVLGQWVSDDTAKLLLPTEADSIRDIPILQTVDRWTYLGLPTLQNKAQKRLYERWYRRKTDFTDMVVHHLTGQEIPFKQYVQLYAGGDNSRGRYLIDKLRLPNGMPILTKYAKPRVRIKLTIFIDGQPVWDGNDPMGMDDYSFVWLNGDYSPEYNEEQMKLQGFASTLRDPQKARTRRVCQALDIVDSVIHTGRIMRDEFITNIDDTYRSGQGIPIHINDKAPEGMTLDEIFKQISGPDIPAGLFGIMEALDKDLTEVGGMNEEIFGSDDKDIPGILHRFRTGQALTGQQGIFQNFRSAKRELGRKNTRLVQLNYEPAKVQRIINEWPAPGFYEPDFTKYDCTPTEGLLTDSQQHLFYLELRHLREVFPEFQQIVPPSVLVKAMPIQFKRELLELIEKQEQQAQQQQQTMLEDKRRMDRLLEAQTAERIAEAEEDRANAMLDRVKTAGELRKLGSDQALDIIDRLLKLQELELKRTERQQAKAKPKKKGK